MYDSVPLLVYEDSKNYGIPVQTEELLRSFGDESVAVISVIGKPKTGKSYILNHIVGNPTAFEVHPQVTRSTKGIQMSIKIYNLDGKKVLLLDNQSFNSSCNSLHDSRVFFINLLLSSVLIYNNFGVIDQQALSHLSLIIGMGQISQTVINKEWNVERPCLLWLVRDFILKLESTTGEPYTSTQYLEKILDDQKGLTTSIVQKNCVRTMIKEMFSKRECQTLVRPAKEEKDLHSLSKIPFQDLRKQFLDDLKRLRIKLAKCIKYKKVNGQLLTGSLILKLVKACLSSFNGKNNSIPTLNGIWTMVQTQQKREVYHILDDICSEIKKQHSKGTITSIEVHWNQRIKSINTLNNLEIKQLIDQKKQELLNDIHESRDLIVPVTFQDINLNFLESVVHKDYSLEEGFDSFNKFSKKNKQNKHMSQKQSRYSTNIEKQLESTKRELYLMQQKCKQFERQRESVMRAIETKDKYSENILSKKRDSLLLSKVDDDTECGVVSKLLEMYQRLQQKYEKISNMAKNTSAYICSHCKIKFEPHQFQRHVQKIKRDDCTLDVPQTPISNKHNKTEKGELSASSSHHQPKASFFTPYIIIPKGILMVDIEKTLIKEDQHHRNYIQYIIKVSLKQSKWTINRKYKDFCELHDILMIMLPELDFPDSSALIKVGMLTNVSNNVNKKNIVEERRKTLQNYLTEIIGIDEVRNTRILQKFLKVNQEYKQLENAEEMHHKSKSPFSSEIKVDSKVGMLQRSSTPYSQTKRYSQSRAR